MQHRRMTGREVRGEIALFNSKGTQLAKRRYDSSWHRNTILQGWKEIYKERWTFYHYQINPTLREEEIEAVQLHGIEIREV